MQAVSNFCIGGNDVPRLICLLCLSCLVPHPKPLPNNKLDVGRPLPRPPETARFQGLDGRFPAIRSEPYEAIVI
jgi:hypothetical protein